MDQTKDIQVAKRHVQQEPHLQHNLSATSSSLSGNDTLMTADFTTAAAAAADGRQGQPAAAAAAPPPPAVNVTESFPPGNRAADHQEQVASNNNNTAPIRPSRMPTRRFDWAQLSPPSPEHPVQAAPSVAVKEVKKKIRFEFDENVADDENRPPREHSQPRTPASEEPKPVRSGGAGTLQAPKTTGAAPAPAPSQTTSSATSTPHRTVSVRNAVAYTVREPPELTRRSGKRDELPDS